MKHKHHDMIVAWAADTSRTVQWRKYSCRWEDCVGTPVWGAACEYRFKPESKPDTIVKCIATDNARFRQSEDYERPNLQLTFDGETGELKSAEVLK